MTFDSKFSFALRSGVSEATMISPGIINQRTGLWTVTSLVPSGNVAST
jgi:hypothetical protein